MSGFIYPLALFSNHFPNSSVLKRETVCASDAHQPVQLLSMSFSMWLIMDTILWFSISLHQGPASWLPISRHEFVKVNKVQV